MSVEWSDGGTMGALGACLGAIGTKLVSWAATRKRSAVETDEIVQRVYGRVLKDVEGQYTKLRDEFIALDEACKAKMAGLQGEVAELRARNHALATVARALVNKKPVPENHRALLDELARADPFDAEAQ